MIFTKIIQTYNLGLKYPGLLAQLINTQTDLANTQIQLMNSEFHVNELQSSLVDAVSLFQQISAEYKALLQAGKIDITTAKPWYEAKYGNTPYMYNYDGLGTKDIRTALRTSDAGVTLFTDAARQFIIDYKLSSSSKPEDVVAAVMLYFSISRNWLYANDQSQFHRNEFWELAENSWATREGDCDDLAILMHVLMFYLFQELGMSDQYWRIKLAVGSVLNEGGHAFNVWLHTDGEWYVVESTYDLRGSYNRTWLHTPVRFNNLYQSFYGFARRDRSWNADIHALEKIDG